MDRIAEKMKKTGCQIPTAGSSCPGASLTFSTEDRAVCLLGILNIASVDFRKEFIRQKQMIVNTLFQQGDA
ncbi:MAG: hypothetical protein HDT18_04235 [Oscillibacter sp.]|nr:hypothetical protein [Oscillibacter sp.]